MKTSDIHFQLDLALDALRQEVRALRGPHGRTVIREHPWGFFLDAIDAERDGLHPDDLQTLAWRNMERPPSDSEGGS